MRDVVIGSRGSQLALWQSDHVRDLLTTAHPGTGIRIEVIKTLGDKVLDSPLSKLGDKGLFTKEIETALLERRVDIAVHSLKDLPTLLPDGLALGAVTKREDPRDAFLPHPAKKVRSIRDVPQGARIATGSLRRASQLLAWRPDLQIVDIRGNLNTRIQKLDASDWDGMILALAGVRRLGWEDRVAEVLPPEIMLPAVGQGALGVEVRDDDVAVRHLVRSLHDEATAAAVTAERAFLRRLEGGCQVPIGTAARVEGKTLVMDAFIGSLDGTATMRDRTSAPPAEAEKAGIALAEMMIQNGAARILEGIRGSAAAEEM